MTTWYISKLGVYLKKNIVGVTELCAVSLRFTAIIGDMKKKYIYI